MEVGTETAVVVVVVAMQAGWRAVCMHPCPTTNGWSWSSRVVVGTAGQTSEASSFRRELASGKLSRLGQAARRGAFSTWSKWTSLA